MTTADTQIDLHAFEAAFKDALPEHLQEQTARAKAKTDQFAGTMPAAGLLSLPDINVGGFCKQWPKVKGFIDMAVTALGWFQPSTAATVKAFVTAFEKTILPVVCPTP